MTYNVLEWEMTFQASNKFFMNMKVVHIFLNNIFYFGIISIWPTHKTLGLSAFQNSQMNDWSTFQVQTSYLDELMIEDTQISSTMHEMMS